MRGSLPFDYQQLADGTYSVDFSQVTLTGLTIANGYEPVTQNGAVDGPPKLNIHDNPGSVDFTVNGSYKVGLICKDLPLYYGQQIGFHIVWNPSLQSGYWEKIKGVAL